MFVCSASHSTVIFTFIVTQRPDLHWTSTEKNDFFSISTKKVEPLFIHSVKS